MTKVTSESTGSSAPKATAPVEGAPPFKNVLHDYALYNYVFTLSVMSNNDINSSNYRTEILSNKQIILRSGNGQPNNRVPTVYTTDTNPSGKYDFIMDDLRIASVAGFKASGGNTNATSVDFKITEPYSMGMFFQVLQAGASWASGESSNYLEVPLLLMIEFYGHLTPDKQLVKVPNVTKYIPIKLREMEMKVTGAGSVYNISAVTWTDIAFTNIHVDLKTDVAIAGKTVIEMLTNGIGPGDGKNLENVLNSRTLQRNKVAQDDNNTEGDFYSISFPESSSQDSGFNAIAFSSMGFDTKRTGMQPFSQENNVYDAASGTFKRSKSIIDPQKTEFKFSQGSDIINVINQVILMSEYGRKALDSVDENGMVNWWRIEARITHRENKVNSSGTYPKNINFRVVPYKVHVSKLSAPGTSLKSKKDLRKEALKEYNYIYTGKNLDVLDFELYFKNSFYTQLSADSGLENADTKLGAQLSTSVGTAPKTTTFKVENADQSKNAFPDRVLSTGIKTRTAHKGGGSLEDFKTQAAKQFHDAITSDTDQITLDLTILGDPYYLSDSGFGNYSAEQTEYFNMNSDGAMDYQSGEVDVVLNFRVPVDNAGPNGLYQFPPKNKGILQAFSGLFQVLTLENNFSKGKFIQTLSLVRRRNQESLNREGNTVTVESPKNEQNSKES